MPLAVRISGVPSSESDVLTAPTRIGRTGSIPRPSRGSSGVTSGRSGTPIGACGTSCPKGVSVTTAGTGPFGPGTVISIMIGPLPEMPSGTVPTSCPDGSSDSQGGRSGGSQDGSGVIAGPSMSVNRLVRSIATGVPSTTGRSSGVVTGASSTGVTVTSTVTSCPPGVASSTMTVKLSGPLKSGAGV